jgi:hypothetical protein
MDPKDLLEQLKLTVSSKVFRTLQAIYEVCEEQRERGSSEFSIAAIAKLGEKRGVPRAQSIRNAPGANYRALIEAFAKAAPAKVRQRATPAVDAWISEIPSPRHQLLAKILVAELAAAKRLIKEIVPPNLEIYVDDRVSKTAFKLDDSERRALEYLLSDDFMRRWNFKRGRMGDVLDQQGEKVFKPGTLDAIEKSLKHL